MLVVEISGKFPLTAHRSHSLRKRLDGTHEKHCLEVVHHFLAVSDYIGVRERGKEEWQEIVFLKPSRDSLHDLIEIQVMKEIGRIALLWRDLQIVVREEDTLELQRR